MRFKELVYNNNTIINQHKIEQVLENENFHWLIDSEIEDAQIEIKNNTLIWHNGNYYSGNWYYGIFKDGAFYGTFENGIIEGGIFQGKFVSGLNLMEI
jgi:hypothetical protein